VIQNDLDVEAAVRNEGGVMTILKTLLQMSYAVVPSLILAISILGQGNTEIEIDLVAAIKDVEAYSTYGGGYDETKLGQAQDNFEAKLLKYTKVPSTLDYDFRDLTKHLSIATSGDRRLRIYAWDQQDGGTMHRFGRVYQFLSADGKVHSHGEKSAAEGMGPGLVTDIFTLDTKGGKVYIVCSMFIGSTKDYFQSAILYKIAGSKLSDDVRLIKTRSGLTNTLSFEYDSFSVLDRTDLPKKLISFEEKTRTLKIPLVIKDEEYPEGRVTTRSISYRFDGRYFVKVG
jgi:hypothetical protein